MRSLTLIHQRTFLRVPSSLAEDHCPNTLAMHAHFFLAPDAVAPAGRMPSDSVKVHHLPVRPEV